MRKPTVLLASGGALAEFGQTFDDLGVPYTMRLRTIEVAPAGAGGEALFAGCYLMVTFDVPFQLRLTPILNGAPLWDESVDIAVDEAPADGEPQTHVWEVGWSLPHVRNNIEVGRYAVIGTWCQVEISMPCPIGVFGNVIIESPIELEIDGVDMDEGAQ